MAAGSGIVALGSAPLVVTLGAFLGMLNAMGRDRGAAPVIEQAALPGTVADRARTRAFAGYGALQDAGHVAGSLMAAIPGLVASHTSLPETSANRLSLGVVPLFAVIALGLYLFLSPGVDAGRGLHVGGRVTLRTRRVLWRCSALFSLDGLGGGLLLTSLLAYFFFERFGASAPAVAGLLSAARVVNLGSNFLAAWLAARVGLVNTMVFTHIPSSLLLVGVALVPSFAWAVALFLARETVAKMDVPTRQSYLMAIVEPEARVVVAGVTDVVRLVAWALGPMLAGWLMTVSLVSPLLAGAAIKIVYDLLLYRAFRHVRPPEERTAPGHGR